MTSGSHQHTFQSSKDQQGFLYKVLRGYYFAKLKCEDYLGDCAMFATPVGLNPVEGLNTALNGVSALSMTDMRKAAGQACEVAVSVCKPIAGSAGPSSLDRAKYTDMAKAFDTLSRSV